MKTTCVLYEETRRGRTSLSMAFDAARMLGNNAVRVIVLSDAGDGKPDAARDEEVRRRVSADVTEYAQGLPFEVVTCAPGSQPCYPNDGIVISTRDLGRRPFDVLMPAHEVALEERGFGPLLVPFSDGETGLVAASAAFELVRNWRAKPGINPPEVIFYHTTWADPAAISDNALDHMCPEAIRVMLAIEKAASEAGVPYRIIVEKHDDVVQGVVEIAQATDTVLIVMARGAQIVQGSYVDRTLAQSPIPVYVAGTNTASAGKPASAEQEQAFREARRELQRNEAAKPEIPWWRRLADLPVLRNPLVVTGIVAFLYTIKAAAKIGIGGWINSPTITGDGFHNIADVLECVAIGVVVFIAARSATESYPYGRKNMEWFTSLAIGIGLCLAAGKFMIDCVIGLLSFLPSLDAAVRSVINLPALELVHIDGSNFGWVVALTLGSFALSQALSRYQIIVGKRTGHASLIANGEETASDGLIEAVTLVGVVMQFLTGWRVLEYILGLLVAVMILRTARELFVSGARVLLQHSLGREHESHIASACLSVQGVSGVHGLKTFQVGHTAVVMVTCESLCDAVGMTYVKTAVEAAITKYLLAEDSDFKGADVHVKMQRPDPRRHREGYAITLDAAGATLASSLERATHLAVCDIEHDDIVRSKVIPLAGADLAGILAEKRVQAVHVFGAGERVRGLATVPVITAKAYTLSTLGLRV